MEPLSAILPFSVNDPLPDLPNYYRNGKIGPGTRYGENIRFVLKLTTCTFMFATLVTSINDFSLFVE